MCQEQYNTNKRKFKQLTYKERVKIEVLYNEEHLNYTEIGKILGKHRTTISRDIKLGSDTMHDDIGDLGKYGIDIIDSVDSELRVALLPQIKTIRKRSQKKITVSEEEKENHENAEKMLNKMSKVLTLPKAKKEDKDKLKNVSIIAKFELVKMGETGDIFKAEQIGKKIVISWNIEHPFYQKFIAENAENENVIKIADFFIYTLASAQIQFIADDSEKFIIMNNIISTMSTNMRNLLS